MFKELLLTGLTDIFEEDLSREIPKFYINLFLICINIFNCPYCNDFLDKEIIIKEFNNDYSFSDIDEEEIKNKKIILEISECCSFLVSKINEVKSLFLKEN